MVFTHQKPTQRDRFGEIPEGLSGSAQSVVGVESGVKNVGGPPGAWGESVRESTPRTEHGVSMAPRASDPLRVRRDGRADHTGKGRTDIRSLHRKHGPTMKGRTTMPPSLQGRAPKAKSQKPSRFRNLYGMRHADVVRDCWRAIKKHAAYGVDRVRAQASAHTLEDNIKHLVERLTSHSSRATLVRRHSRPKGGGTGRPLGIPVVEDTLVHLAVTRRLTAIYAQDFLRCRSGYRPHVGALDAVDALTITRQCGRDHWVVEADITGFFDHIDQEWILRMLAERLDDRALLRLIKQWLKAGGLDTDGTVRHPATGSPQGGVVSPILANVSWHEALDLWCANVVTRHGHGEACLIRSADDAVCACEQREDAERCSTVLGQRVRTCGLELSGDTTRRLPCSRRPAAAPTRCECLGCALHWGKDRAGTAPRKRRTSRQK